MKTERELSEYRLEQAAGCLKAAKALVDIGEYKSAANRSYYCIFNAMRSLLALEKVDFKRHKGVINFFREQYIKTGVLDNRLSVIVELLFKIRSASDYDDYYLVSKSEITEQVENAEYFLEQIKQHLSK